MNHSCLDVVLHALLFQFQNVSPICIRKSCFIEGDLKIGLHYVQYAFQIHETELMDPEFDSIELLYAMCPRKPYNRRHNIHITVSSFFKSVFPCAVFMTPCFKYSLTKEFHRQA